MEEARGEEADEDEYVDIRWLGRLEGSTQFLGSYALCHILLAVAATTAMLQDATKASGTGSSGTTLYVILLDVVSKYAMGIPMWVVWTRAFSDGKAAMAKVAWWHWRWLIFGAADCSGYVRSLRLRQRRAARLQMQRRRGVVPLRLPAGTAAGVVDSGLLACSPDLLFIAAQMDDPVHGLLATLQTRKWGFVKYAHCFLAEDLLGWLVDRGFARAPSVRGGRSGGYAGFDEHGSSSVNRSISQDSEGCSAASSGGATVVGRALRSLFDALTNGGGWGSGAAGEGPLLAKEAYKRAMALSRRLLRSGLIHHVLMEHEFKVSALLHSRLRREHSTWLFLFW